MKHAELVKAAERWLRHPKQGKCPVVLVEVRGNAVSEQPVVTLAAPVVDAIKARARRVVRREARG